MIKKCIFCLTLFFMAQLSYGQNINELFVEFSTAEKAESVKLNKFAMAFIKPFTNNELKGVSSMQVLDLSQCKQSIKEEFAEKSKKIKDQGYETLLQSKEDNEDVRILVKIKDDIIRELIILTSGDDCALVKISGKFSKSDIERLEKRN